MTEPRDIIVIGGSAGSVEALTHLVSRLPGELDAAIFVVIHSYPIGDSLLPAILSRRGRLVARVAEDGQPIECDRIYVAARDSHMLLEPGRVRLSHGPKESGHRPAIDPLFRSAARVYGERVIGVILSGMLDDGSAGLRMIRRHGGSTMVQEPAEALFPQMPQNAIDAASPQHVAPVAEIARLIATHAGRSVKGGEIDKAMSAHVSSNGEPPPLGAADAPGSPTGIACPECHGVMWAADDEDSPEFACRVGHAYSSQSLFEAHAESVEAALWAAVRSLQEQSSLTRHLAGRAKRRGDKLTAAHLQNRSRTADEQATTIEALLVTRTANPA